MCAGGLDNALHMMREEMTQKGIHVVVSRNRGAVLCRYEEMCGDDGKINKGREET